MGLKIYELPKSLKNGLCILIFLNHLYVKLLGRLTFLLHAQNKRNKRKRQHQ
jgi:hypothetical protein